MADKALVDRLVASKAFGEGSRAWLEVLGDEQLEMIIAHGARQASSHAAAPAGLYRGTQHAAMPALPIKRHTPMPGIKVGSAVDARETRAHAARPELAIQERGYAPDGHYLMPALVIGRAAR